MWITKKLPLNKMWKSKKNVDNSFALSPCDYGGVGMTKGVADKKEEL